MENPQTPGAFKSQPWVLFDTIASKSFLMGDSTADGLAIGSQIPSISSAGEITFFQSSGRTRATMPWYTNLDVAGQLAYGLQVWQIYLNIVFPTMPNRATTIQDLATVGPAQGPIPTTIRLAEAILNFGVLSMNLGQENQAEWPLSRFGAGGGLALATGGSGSGPGNGGMALASNSIPATANVMKLPEPIEMGRTQNLSAKIKLAPEVFDLIGSIAAPGVGSKLGNYFMELPGPVLVNRAMMPFQVQLGFVGRRIKDTQYGQVVRG
jgi:hypothetical protein